MSIRKFLTSHIRGAINPDDLANFGTNLKYLYNEGDLCDIPWTTVRQSNVTVSFDSSKISMTASSGIKCGCISTYEPISLANYTKLVMYCSCNVGTETGFTYLVEALCKTNDWYPGSSDSKLYHRLQSSDQIGHTGTFPWTYLIMDLTASPMEFVSSCPVESFINLALYSTSSSGSAYIKRVFLVP